MVREAYVYVFGHSNVSFWPVLACQSEFFNFLVLVVGLLLSSYGVVCTVWVWVHLDWTIRISSCW